MVPVRREPRRSRQAAPRTRGDGPWPVADHGVHRACSSPHPRGWSHPHQRPPGPGRLLPAPAGMAPPPGPPPAATAPALRTRGDGPGPGRGASWNPDCSPHPRGWPLDPIRGSRPGRLLPAPAGMAPGPPATPAPPQPAPRTRGDGPRPRRTACRACFCSPHPRGWPRQNRDDLHRHALLPAPAGMAPMRGTTAAARSSAPRTRGDGPSPVRVARSTVACSPHPRGWPLARGGAVGARTLLPAPAGMAPFGDVMQS